MKKDCQIRIEQMEKRLQQLEKENEVRLNQINLLEKAIAEIWKEKDEEIKTELLRN